MPAFSHPFLVLAAVTIAALALQHVWRPHRAWLHHLGLLPLAGYVGIAVWYGFSPTYYDHAEPSIAALSWRLVHFGQDIYHRVDTAERLALPYGPMLFALHGWLLSLAGPGIAVSKALGIVAGLATLLAIFVNARGRGARAALTITSVAALACLSFGPVTFWNRADSLLLALVALSMLCVSRGATVASIVVGLALGVSLNLKITAATYCIPVLVALWRRHGALHTGIAAGIGLVAFAAPFMALEGVHLTQYVAWLQVVAGQGVRLAGAGPVLEWAMVLLLLPAMALVRASPPRALPLALIASVVATLPAALKFGGGPHHLVPFIPLVAAIFGSEPPARLNDKRAHALKAGLVATMVVIGVLQQLYWIPAVANQPGRDIIAEIRAFERNAAGPTAMGYSPYFRASFFRPILVFSGQPYLFDGTAMMEHQISGIGVPASSVEAVRACVVTDYLMPRGGEPFALPNIYSPSTNVFPATFQEAFRASYRRVASGQYFDVWRCATR